MATVVIGIDSLDKGLQLAKYVQAMGIVNPRICLVHIVKPVWIPKLDLELNASSDALEAAVYKADREAAERTLEKVATEFVSKDVLIERNVIFGQAVPELLRVTEEKKADLLVVGNFEHPRVDRILLGSVSKGVVTGAKTSVLVVKLPVERKDAGAFNAVFATDLSDYCNSCIKLLQQHNLCKIDNLTVLSVYPQDEVQRLKDVLPARVDEYQGLIMKDLLAKTKKLGDELTSFAKTVDIRVKLGQIDETIQQTMSETKSDLLILGAQGHGWFERFFFGSVSLQQVASGRYSVLVARAGVVNSTSSGR